MSRACSQKWLGNIFSYKYHDWSFTLMHVSTMQYYKIVFEKLETALNTLIWIHDTVITIHICFKLNFVSKNITMAHDWNPHGRICWLDSTVLQSASMKRGSIPNSLKLDLWLSLQWKFTLTIAIIKTVKGMPHTQITTLSTLIHYK